MKTIQNRMYRSFFTFLITGFMICTIELSVYGQGLEELIFLEGSYENPAYVGNPTETPPIFTGTCAMFSGNVGPEKASTWDQPENSI